MRLALAATTAAVLFAAPAVAQQVPASALQALHWRLVGPFRGGRVTAVAGHPAQPLTFYFGATGGGVWKTTDAGVVWKNVSDGFFHTTTIGAIAVAPSNPEVVYVGTGESAIRGVAAASGDGVYKSIDGGKTWKQIGLSASKQISRIVVDAKNPDVVYVAAQGDPWGDNTERGVYRSDDGGATWKKLLYVNASTGASDVSVDAHDPNVVYAAMWDHRRTPWNVISGGPGSSIWKSTDAGAHWSKLTAGLPKLMGNIGVAVSPVDPKVVFAMVEATEGGVYRSDDAGATWRRVNSDQGIRDRGWYYSRIFADPKDVQRVYVLASGSVVSHDGGKTFQRVPTPHGDNHALWINPEHPEVMVEGNDGGAQVSLDDGKTWSSQMNQPTGQFYRIETDNLWPYNIYSAQQDRSSIRIASATTHAGIGEQDWADMGGGESAYVALYRQNPKLVYATNILGGLSELDTSSGLTREIDPYPVFAGFHRGVDLTYRFNWNAPVRVVQQDPKTIYHGAQKLLRSTDRGVTWTAISPDLTRARRETLGTTGGPIMIEGAGGEQYATLTDIVVSPPQAIWTGSDDGLVHVTRDGGKSWSNATPKGLPESDINAIEVSALDPAKVYVAAYRYKLDDFGPYAFRTDDGGKTWTSIVAGLPKDDFVEVVRADPIRPGLLYAGMGWGAYVSFDDGGHWQPLQLNLPVAPVTDLQVKGDELIAATQGRAIWILDGLSALRDVTAETVAEPSHLFAPKPALRLEGTDSASPSDGTNPTPGAVIYYSLAAKPAGEATLEILDAQGQVVRRFSSAIPEVKAVEETVKGADRQPPPAPLPVKPGLNRYVWDLRLANFTPVDDTIRYVSQHPPRVGPGVYKVRLTVDGKVSEQTLTVLPHPGTAATAQEWAEQQRLSRVLYDLVNDNHATTNAVRALQAKLEASHGDPKRIARLKAWQEQVPQAPLPNGVVDKIGYPSRLLSTQIFYTLSVLDGPPPVGAAVRTHVQELVAQWAGMKAEADKLLAGATARLEKPAGAPRTEPFYGDGGEDEHGRDR